MYGSILVPTDGSDVATTAAESAIAIARQYDAELHVLHVVESIDLPGEFPGLQGELVQQGNAYVSDIDDRAASAGVDSTMSVQGAGTSPHQAILEYVDEHGIDLVAMGTRGRTGLDRLLLGSVAERTLVEAAAPVLTVREDVTVDPSFRSILVPFDGSEGSMAAVEHAVSLAQTTDATITFCHVIDQSLAVGDYNDALVMEELQATSEDVIDTAVKQAEGAGVQTTDTPVLVGKPYEEIVRFADEQDHDCIVMGTHGQSTLGERLLGSTTSRVIRKASVPVISVRPEESGE